MIGDNSHDIEAGHRAGVRATGVAWAIKERLTYSSINQNICCKICQIYLIL